MPHECWFFFFSRDLWGTDAKKETVERFVSRVLRLLNGWRATSDQISGQMFGVKDCRARDLSPIIVA